MNKWIILDRDGVINEDSVHFIKTPEEWIPIPGSLEAIALMHQKGYRIAVATNQSGIARGYLSETVLVTIHRKMTQLVESSQGKISAIVYCPHGPTENCDCRKPKPGMLSQLISEKQLNLNEVCYVGDSLRDLQAAKAAGCRGILVKTGNGSKTLAENCDCVDLEDVYEDLLSFAKSL